MVFLIAISSFIALATLGSFVATLLKIGKTAAETVAGSAEGTVMGSLATPVAVEEGELEPAKLVVRHLKGKAGEATLLVRERPGKKAISGQLLIVAGKKKKFRRDSLYELGFIQEERVSDECLDGFIKLARAKMEELAVSVKRRGRAKVAKLAEPPEQTVVVAAVPVPTAATLPLLATGVSVDQNQSDAGTIILRKYPSMSRGVILEVGYMPRPLDGRTLKQYGVKCRTAEGVEDVVWGVNLGTALHDAGAGVGDKVEILKIGRKVVEEGKAPMNLYTCTKLT
ncbi:MAG: hypothetical protein D4R84_02615 [Rhodocyclaceae bacterium]|nr:MAG: hypothetical protein D4R84_02615 [Rhodocyclaceae bacterium]